MTKKGTPHLGRLVKDGGHVFLLAFQAFACVDRFRTGDPGFFPPQLHFLSFGGEIGRGQVLGLRHFRC